MPRLGRCRSGCNVTTGEGNSTPDRLLVIRALAQLCPEHRAVVRHSHYLGLTTAQIAADLGIAEDTVKSRLHCALHALRELLQQMTLTSAQGENSGPVFGGRDGVFPVRGS
jgi:DNA-directed RNA polymerase specialized sigma24 family protein